jgi:hypothetical protein
MALPYTFGTQTGTIPLNELDENFLYLENLVPALAVSAGTVITASQPNITAVGTLTGLNCSGTITAGTVTAAILNGTLSANAQPNITEIGTLTNLTVTNTLLAGTVTATTVGTAGGSLLGTVATAAQPNITSLGTLSGLTVAGTVSASTLAGTVTTAAQPSITSLGTLSSLAVTGNISGGNVSGTTLTGTLATAAQPNITGVGTLTVLGVSGAVTAGSLSVSGTSALSGTVTAPTAGNGTSNTQVATTQFVQNTITNASTVPSGAILLWSGSIASIPAGWFLCDGNNNTPDLRDRFVVGAGSIYSPAATGGSPDAIVVSHTHTATSVVTDPGHNHTYSAPSGFDSGGSFGGSVVENIVSSTTGNRTTGVTVATTIASAGASGTNANLPPYYALAYIMKA